MASMYSVRLDGLETAAERYDNIIQRIDRAVDEAGDVDYKLFLNIFYLPKAISLKRCINHISSVRDDLNSLNTALREIIDIYSRTENFIILNAILPIIGIMHGRHHGHISDSAVCDDDGAYGGDQGSPQYQWGDGSQKQVLYDTVRKYYPNMTDQEISDYLRKLNSEGCGYVAIVNTIFAAYQGRELEFEEKFGFPMYHDGDLNYDRLLVDFYSATDNHNNVNGVDTISGTEDSSSTDGYGTTPDSQQYRAYMYLDSKGVNVDIKTDQNVTVDNYQDYSKDGYVVINYHDGNLEDANGNVIQNIGPNEGHSMTVTGVTEDGRYIVSSWGQKMYLRPNNNSDFVVYKYKG